MKYSKETDDKIGKFAEASSAAEKKKAEEIAKKHSGGDKEVEGIIFQALKLTAMNIGSLTMAVHDAHQPGEHDTVEGRDRTHARVKAFLDALKEGTVFLIDNHVRDHEEVRKFIEADPATHGFDVKAPLN
jgi:hypothetical protein